VDQFSDPSGNYPRSATADGTEESAGCCTNSAGRQSSGDCAAHGDHDYYISGAMVLQSGLQKGHKCADDPWD